MNEFGFKIMAWGVVVTRIVLLVCVLSVLFFPSWSLACVGLLAFTGLAWVEFGHRRPVGDSRACCDKCGHTPAGDELSSSQYLAL